MDYWRRIENGPPPSPSRGITPLLAIAVLGVLLIGYGVVVAKFDQGHAGRIGTAQDGPVEHAEEPCT